MFCSAHSYKNRLYAVKVGSRAILAKQQSLIFGLTRSAFLQQVHLDSYNIWLGLINHKLTSLPQIRVASLEHHYPVTVQWMLFRKVLSFVFTYKRSSIQNTIYRVEVLWVYLGALNIQSKFLFSIKMFVCFVIFVTNLEINYYYLCIHTEHSRDEFYLYWH